MTSPVPLNPDGTPNLGAKKVPVGAGGMSLWDVPHDLIDYLNQTSNGMLVFDIGHRTTSVPTDAPGITRPGLITDNIGKPAPKMTTKNEAYNIYKSPWQVMAQFQAMSYNDPAKFLAIQNALAQSPFGKVNVNGVFDPYTEKALGVAMMQYVKLSMGTGAEPVYVDPKTGKKSGGFVAYLLNAAEAAQANGGNGTSAAATQAPTYQVTDSESIRQSALAAAQQALGQNISGDQLDAFVRKFQAAQISAQQNALPGQTYSMPDLTAQAMAYVQSNNKQAYQENQRTAYLDQLVNLLGGNRPNQQPSPGV